VASSISSEGAASTWSIRNCLRHDLGQRTAAGHGKGALANFADDVLVALFSLEGAEHTGAPCMHSPLWDDFAIEMSELSINQTSWNKDNVIPPFRYWRCLPRFFPWHASESWTADFRAWQLSFGALLIRSARTTAGWCCKSTHAWKSDPYMPARRHWPFRMYCLADASCPDRTRR